MNKPKEDTWTLEQKKKYITDYYAQHDTEDVFEWLTGGVLKLSDEDFNKILKNYLKDDDAKQYIIDDFLEPYNIEELIEKLEELEIIDVDDVLEPIYEHEFLYKDFYDDEENSTE